MDGGSTDNSVEIIKRYARKLTYWHSRPDHGQSDALRQGFAHATGAIMNWVNSDDLLAPGALEHIAQLHKQNPSAGILAASTEHFCESPADTFDKVTPANWRPETFLHVCKSEPFAFNQPSVFFTRAIYEQIGGINSAFHMAMDYELFLRMCEMKPEIVYSSQTAAFFRHHEASKTGSGTLKNLIAEHAERLQIYNQAFQRTGLKADRSRSVNLLHWWLFYALRHGDTTNVRLAYHALRRHEGASAWAIVVRIAALLTKRMRNPLRGGCPAT